MRHLRVVVTLCAALLLAGCPQGSNHDTAPAIEVEDCDAEDRANREAECGFPPSTPRRTTPKPEKTRNRLDRR